MLQENAVSGRSVHEDGDLACAIDPKTSAEIESARHLKYSVSVRALCKFTEKQGDLDLRFTPSPSAQAGIAGHGVVTSRRSPNYQSEVSLSGEFKNLLVRGRADGFDPAQNQIEEIKTFRGDLGTMPDNHRKFQSGSKLGACKKLSRGRLLERFITTGHGIGFAVLGGFLHRGHRSPRGSASRELLLRHWGFGR